MGLVNPFYYPTSRATAATLREYARLNTVDKIDWGLPGLDDYLVPHVAGLMHGIVARTSNGKSSLMVHLARHAAKKLKPDEYVVYITYETLVEQFVTNMVSHITGIGVGNLYRDNIDINAMESVLVDLIGTRMVIIGRSMETPSEGRLTLGVVDNTLREMENTGLKPGMLLVDYLQIMEHDDLSLNRTAQVTDHIIRLKTMGQRYKVPTCFAVQAGRSLDDKTGVRWPDVNSSEWSSSIEQTVDSLVGVTRPIQYMDEGTEINQSMKGGTATYTVNQNLMGINIIKQRFGAVNIKRFYHYTPQTMEFAPIDPHIKEDDSMGLNEFEGFNFDE